MILPIQRLIANPWLDVGTARLIARARKQTAAGMPLIPKEVVDRIARSENALRALREWRGKTQLYISHKKNIGQGYISDPESRRRKGTPAALKKIAIFSAINSSS
jgi:predicted transcriptional regulator